MMPSRRVDNSPPSIPVPITNIAEISPVMRATNSRPCYRCINYMRSVGIKRVFWTNKEGRWEGAKVRDLVLVLNGCGVSGSYQEEVFVTKHGILMRTRLIGV